MNQTVSVIGLGKLGACMAATMAQKGMNVIGVDVNPKFVDTINQGLPPVAEPQLAELIATYRDRLRATTDYGVAVRESNITFVIVPTPSDERGAFTLRFVNQTMREIGKALREKKSYHLVVLTSTVLPGSSQYGVLPVLEQASGKKCGIDFGFCYNPEFIALGTVVRDLLNPDFILVGESDERAGKLLEDWYRSYLSNKAPVSRMNFVNAELTKIALNTYVTTKITFANMLMTLCEQIPGGDVGVVSRALGQDTRIGVRCLSGGLGYGGPCFPRDNQALSFMARKVGVAALLAETTDRMNKDLVAWTVAKIRASVPVGKTVGILGLAYKPDTVIIEESHGVAIAKALANQGGMVVVYDPLATEAARSVLGDSVAYAASPGELLAQSDAVVITIPCHEFKSIGIADFPTRAEPVLVFDCWRLLGDRLAGSSAVRYQPFGVGATTAENTGRLDKLWRND